MKLFFKLFNCVITACLLGQTVMAHPGHGISGEHSGISHYVFSVEHGGLLLMIAAIVCIRFAMRRTCSQLHN